MGVDASDMPLVRAGWVLLTTALLQIRVMEGIDLFIKLTRDMREPLMHGAMRHHIVVICEYKELYMNYNDYTYILMN